MDGRAAALESGRHIRPPVAPRRKGKYRPEIPRFLNYLRRTARRYRELAPLYALLLELVGDEELQTGYTF